VVIGELQRGHNARLDLNSVFLHDFIPTSFLSPTNTIESLALLTTKFDKQKAGHDSPWG
jgi:hypothetical protein